MRRFLCAALFALAAVLPAQESPEQPEDEPILPSVGGEDSFAYRANQAGDQFIKFNLMVDLPIRPAMDKLQVGGSGTISYMRFLNSSFMLGGDLSFGYNVTIGSNVFTFVPILFKASYQPVFKKFEFPLSLGVGVSFENYLTRTYFGPVFKPEIGAYWRIVPEWSFGIHYGVYFMPQWYSDSKYTYLGIIQDLGISGRFHF